MKIALIALKAVLMRRMIDMKNKLEQKKVKLEEKANNALIDLAEFTFKNNLFDKNNQNILMGPIGKKPFKEFFKIKYKIYLLNEKNLKKEAR